jgi:peptidoglycan/LPS O-acetylase OafA/YrhL
MSNDIETAEPLPPKIDIDNSVKQKRDDIQLLRAFSILCVLIYHLNGEWLPFGYFGVDIFFVISGFLMAFIIVTPKNSRMTIQLAFDFYYRRVKRIVPTYLIVISLTLIVGAFLIYPLDRRSLADEAKSSLLFVLNLQSLWTKVEYFELITLYKFCTHLWSLCAELQFYIIVPPTFCLLFKMNQPLRVVFCSIIIVASFVAQLQLPDLFKHAFTPCRLWQFFIGILCFYVQVKEWNTKGSLLKLGIF